MSEQEQQALEIEQAAVVEAPEVAEASATPDPVEAEARRLGWKPKEEWRGDTSRWTDAATFMERATIRRETVAELEARLDRERRENNERLERIERANAAALKAARERIAAELRQAVEVGDVARWETLDRQRQEIDAPAAPSQRPPEPPPETLEWTKRNPWFNTDPVMNAAAKALASEAMRMGMLTPAEQLRYVDQEMPRQFPHKFRAAAPAVSAVDPGGMGVVRKAAKGWDQIPAEDRRAAMIFIEDGTMTKEQYAKEYWAMEA